MAKNCKHCGCELNEQNAARKNAKYFRNECKPCRSKQVVARDKQNPEKRKIRINLWVRKIGRVKQYPCEGCGTLCYKKYARAFCSDKCRFMAHVEVTENCWLWKSSKDRRGYGKTNFQNKRNISAHRLAYELFIGPIEDSSLVCHACDNPSCVKPAHLWLGTHKENMMDMVDKGRQHSKLTPLDIFKIRELVEKFGVSNKKICEQYGLMPGTVSNIIAKRIWKHV